MFIARYAHQLPFQARFIVVCLVVLLVAGCGTSNNSRTMGFSYQVRVSDATTNQYISRARVTLEVSDLAPLDELSDSNGFARLLVSEDYIGRPGRLIIEAPGFETYIQHIDISQDLPTEILLQPAAIATVPRELPSITPVALQPTELPINTSVAISSATPTQEATPTVTATPTIVPEQTALNIGESFEGEGLKITLASYTINESGVFLSFVMQNVGQNPVLVRYRNNNIRVSENGGRILDQSPAYIDTLKQCPLDPGSSITIDSGGTTSPNNVFAACNTISYYPDVVSEQTTSIIITLTGFMGLGDIKWQTPPLAETPSPPNSGSEEAILRFGESFEGNGLKIMLASHTINERGVFLSFIIQNVSQSTILVRYRNNNIQVSENSGRILDQSPAYIDTLKQCSLDPGSSITIDSGGSTSSNNVFAACDTISYYPDVVSEQATSLIVTLTRFMGLTDIKWQIDL